MSTAPAAKPVVDRIKEYVDLPPLMADVAYLMRRQLAKKSQKMLTINISWDQQPRLKKVKKIKKSAELFKEPDEPIQEKKIATKESVGHNMTIPASVETTGVVQPPAAEFQTVVEVQTADIRAIPTGENYTIKTAREDSPRK